MASVPPAQPPAAPRKTSPWVWVAIGCGGVLLIVVIVLSLVFFVIGKKVRDYAQEAKKNPAVAAVKLAIAFNPDLELVGTDESTGVITIRNRKTGESLTVDMAEAKQGRIRFRNEKGEEVTLEGHGGEQGSFKVSSKDGELSVGGATGAKLPPWVPTYPGAKPTGSMSQHEAGALEGTYMFGTADKPDAVLAYFEKQLKAAGFTVETTTAQGGPLSISSLNAKADDGRREVAVTALPTGETVQVTVHYKGPAE